MPGRTLPAFVSSTLALLLASGAAHAQQDTYYKCIDERGNTTFSNVSEGKGCTKLFVDPLVSPPKNKSLPAKKPESRTPLKPKVEEPFRDTPLGLRHA